MRIILEHLGVHYEYLNSDFRLSHQDQEFWTFLGSETPVSGIELSEALPELVGLEPDISQLMASGQGEIKLPAIRRGARYGDISVIPINKTDSAYGNSQALVMLTDATERMEQHRLMIQKRNEIALLSRALEFRNAELAAANKRLDSLMSAIRTKNHDLNLMVMNATKELHNTRLSVIMMLATVAEFRDTDTGGHIFRIGRISSIIAKQLNLSIAERETIFYASLLHDVGKVGIPDSILLKNQPLSEAEVILMQSHCQIGADLFKKHNHHFFADIHDVVLYHHERWDGSGYPKGLAGESIPLGARICAVADVFDALVSKRPYKQAWGFELAVTYIKERSGQDFDPIIVTAFLASLEEIRALSEENFEELDDLEDAFA